MKEWEFIELLRNKQVEITAKQKEQFAVYCSLLSEYNSKVNLTSIVEKEEVYGKHFYDSLTVIYDRQLYEKVADVGSGGGFPGIPLKIVCPDIELVLIEPQAKKMVFLRLLVEKLGLEDVTFLQLRAEEVAKEYRESFTFVLSRAVARLNILCELCLPLVKVGGSFIAMKGLKAREELLASQRAIELLGGEVKDVYQHFYDDQTRYNIDIRKKVSTALKYPRSYGQIKKSPL